MDDIIKNIGVTGAREDRVRIMIMKKYFYSKSNNFFVYSGEIYSLPT